MMMAMNLNRVLGETFKGVERAVREAVKSSGAPPLEIDRFCPSSLDDISTQGSGRTRKKGKRSKNKAAIARVQAEISALEAELRRRLLHSDNQTRVYARLAELKAELARLTGREPQTQSQPGSISSYNLLL